MHIAFVAPRWRNAPADADTTPDSNLGLSLYEYVDAMIDKARKLKVPVFDLYRNAGINKFNYATFLVDGTHSDEGDVRTAEKNAAFLGSAV